MSIEADIEEITRMVWTTMFDESIERSAEGRLDGGPAVTSLVHIEGAWHGAVMLRCPLALAMTLTAAMFRMDATPTGEELRDAVGEINNVLAGNVKALLPEHCTLSLPCVVHGDDYKIEVMATAEVATVAFVAGGETMVVSLLQSLEGGAPGSRDDR